MPDLGDRTGNPEGLSYYTGMKPQISGGKNELSLLGETGLRGEFSLFYR